MIARALARAAASLAAALAVGALGLGCPAKDLDVAISRRGIIFFSYACAEAAACASAKTQLGCLKDTGCEWDAGACRGRCLVPGNPAWSISARKDLQVLLFSSDPARLRQKSACVPLAATPCGPDDDPVQCSATAVGDAVNAALTAGPELTFAGFTDPSQGFVAVAVFQRPETADGTEPPDCSPGRLVAATGLDVPLNHQELDIECASCQGGLRAAVGEDTRPCPSNLGAKQCFLEACFAALSGAAL